MTDAANIRRRCRKQQPQPLETLGDQVTVKVEITGRIVARTLEAESHVDIVAPDGTLWRNIPVAWISPAAEVVKLPRSAAA